MKRKINLRLAWIALIAVIATTIGVTTVYYNLFRHQVREYLGRNVLLLSQSDLFHGRHAVPAEKSAPSVHVPATGRLQASEATQLFAGKAVFFNTLKTENLRVTWIDAGGRVLGDNYADISRMDNHLNRPEVQEALKNGSGESIRNSDTLGTEIVYYAMRLEDGTILRVSTQAQTIASVFLEILPVILLIELVVLAICLLLSHLLTRQLIRPIEAMAEHIDDDMMQPVYSELIPFSNKIRSQHDRILAVAKSRQDFTANVSHELKTPLTAISGYAELIENGMVGTEQHAHMAKQIHHNARRLLSLINNIIQLSELDHMEQPHQFVSFDLHHLAQECCENLEMNAMQKKVALSCDGAEVSVSADLELIRELLTNLIQNAILYNNDGGWVKVTVNTVSGHPILRVADNGIGIPKDMQERVFERFYRVDKSRSRETGGTGLGLSLVKHIAEIHGAEITLDSELGKGTSISVRF